MKTIATEEIVAIPSASVKVGWRWADSLQCGEDFDGMFVRFHLGEDGCDFSLR